MRRLVRGLAAFALLALATAAFCWKLLFGGLTVIGYDTMTYMYPYRFFAAEALREGRLPLWNPHIYYGVPFLANLQSAVFYPLHILFVFLPSTTAMNLSVALHLFLAAWFAYMAARGIMGLDRLSATVAGALYGLSGFVGSQVGHLNQLNAAAWLPLSILTLHLSLTRHSPRWIAATGAILGIQLLAGHAQESYMTVVALGAYAAFHTIQGSLAALRAFTVGTTVRAIAGEAVWAGLALGVAGALAAGIAAVQLLPTQELSGYSIRAGGMSFGEAASFSLPPRELFVGMLPAFGLASPTSNEYLGWIGFGGLALLLFGALFRLQRPAVLFFFLLALVSFMLALGNHFALYEWVFKLPGMRLFRVPARWLMLTTLANAMLAGAGLAFIRQLALAGWPAGAFAGSDAPAGPWQRLVAASRLLLGVGAVTVVAALLWPPQKPGPGTLPDQLLWIWTAVAGAAVAMSFWALASAPSRWPGIMLTLFVFGELFFASRSLEYNNPNPPSVYTDSRPVHTALRSAAAPGDRYLSIAATGYHPSDAKKLVSGFEPILGPDGVLATLINTKYKEVLAPNLSMVYDLRSVDGYDGGVLPLRRHVDHKRLVVPREQNVPDALLRDQLRRMPSAGQLRTLGADFVIADTIADVTRDGVYIDLADSIALRAGQVERLEIIGPAANAGPIGPATAISIVTSLEGGGAYPEGAPVLAVTIGADPAPGVTSNPGPRVITLNAGTHTAEGAYSTAARHQQPVPLGPSGAGGSATATYLARVPVGPAQADWIAIESLLVSGRVHVHGITLTGERDQQWPVTLAAGGSLRLVHRSDVKLYKNERPLPRAYVVQSAMLAADLDGAIGLLSSEGHDMRSAAVLERAPFVPPPSATPRGRARRALDGVFRWLGIERDLVPGALPEGKPMPPLPGAVTPARTETSVQWVADTAERTVVQVTAPEGGLLVMRDTYFPGWSATVDGRPADLLRADVLFRAVYLPPGQPEPHVVELTYRSRALERGVPFSLISVTLTALLALLPYRRLTRLVPLQMAWVRATNPR